MCIKVIIQIAINKVLSLVHTVPDFSTGVATVQCGACRCRCGVVPVGPGVHIAATPGLKAGTV